MMPTAIGSASAIISNPSPLAIDRSRASPNFGERAAGFATPSLIVLHYTGMRDGPSAVDWLCDPTSQVSCHYVVEEGGRVLQLVPETQRAWHAGRSSWAGITDVNSASIGVEIVNGGHDYGLPPFPDTQIDAVIALCMGIADRHRIAADRILAHSDIAPGRKRDPGERFPWDRLALNGVGHFVPPAPERAGAVLEVGSESAAVLRLQQALANYGYGIEPTGRFDQATAIVVSAFQRRFRPAFIDGRADPQTRDTLDHLLASRPGA